MQDHFFYWTSENTRLNDLMEFPTFRRRNVFHPSSSSWKGGAERKGLVCN